MRAGLCRLSAHVTLIMHAALPLRARRRLPPCLFAYNSPCFYLLPDIRSPPNFYQVFSHGSASFLPNFIFFRSTVRHSLWKCGVLHCRLIALSHIAYAFSNPDNGAAGRISTIQHQIFTHLLLGAPQSPYYVSNDLHASHFNDVPDTTCRVHQLPRCSV